jgi:TonB family protein
LGTAKTLGLLALVVIPVAVATAQGGPRDPASEIVRVKWLRPPSPKTFPSTPPCHGDRTFTPGAAELECKLTADGHVSSCFVVSELPADCAYGQAALSLVRSFQAKATLDGGRIRAGMRVRIPMKFQGPPA